MKRFPFFCMLLLLVCQLSVAMTTFTVRQIKVDGLHRISRDTVLSYVPIKVGQVVTPAKSDQILKDLYATGFFSQIQLKQQQSTLVIKVTERPIITKIDIEGAEEIKKQDIEKLLQKIGLTVGQAIQENQLKLIKTALEQNYAALGIYGAKVKVETVDDKPGRVILNITIHEGDIASVKEIRLIGNTHFPTSQLLKQMQTKSSRIWSPLLHDDRFSRQKLQADLESLRSFYYDHGYLDFKILSSNVSLSDDGEAVYITIHLHEGSLYHISHIQLQGRLLTYSKSLKSLLHVKAGDVFSRSQLATNLQAMNHLLANHGYAFATVKVQSVPDHKRHTVALTLIVEPGQIVYVRSIFFSGNSVTSDAVLRREMRQLEGSIFSYHNVEESTRRLKNLGFVNKIQMTTKRVPGRPDQIDLVFKVEEKFSAEIKLSMGYSSAEKWLYGIGWRQDNVLGSGKNINIGLQRSKSTLSAHFDYTNPYWTESGVSQNIGISYVKSTPDKIDLGDYRRDTMAVYTGYDFPITEYQRFGLSVRLEHTDLHLNANTPTNISDFTNKYGDQFKLLSVGAHWRYDHYDQAIFPTKGWQHYLGLSVTNTYTGSSLHYYKTQYVLGWYEPIRPSLVFHARGAVRYAGGFSGTDEIPPYESYYLGGLGSVAGYDSNGLGPKNSNDQAMGGQAAIDGSLSLIMPLKFSEDARLITFIDGGNVFKNKFDLGQLRYSVGVGLVWNIAGMAPLQFAVAKAINPNGEGKRLFDFSLGTSF